MYNIFKKHRRWRLMSAILSLSLLTVMAGAAVAPALNLIGEYFSDAGQGLVQMIISLPALFIALMSFLFRPLSKHLRSRTLVMIGLTLYTVGGCIAGLFSNIYLVLICRALVGVGVGILMPLSTGLIAFFFTKDKQTILMGYSSAMNMMGGVVATIIAGFLAMHSWRLAFLVYLMGFISIVLCALWMPNEKIYDPKENIGEKGTLGKYKVYIFSMFLLMVSFFIYPANFAIETSKAGIIPQALIAIIMAAMDLSGFVGGLCFAGLRKSLGRNMRFAAPAVFLTAYALLGLVGGWAGTIAGSLLVGFANGIGVPFIMTSASMKAGKTAAVTVMPLLSAALYFAQFFTPMILAGLRVVFSAPELSSYFIAMGIAVLFGICSALIKSEDMTEQC